jgi:hypothetical protein
MIDNSDVWRSAEGMLKTHGDKAAMHCAMSVERFRQRGDAVGVEVWESILNAVRQLEAKATGQVS